MKDLTEIQILMNLINEKNLQQLEQEKLSSREFNRLPPSKRYNRDIQFKYLVDTIIAFINEGRFTPTKLREAVTLAAIKYDYYAHKEFIINSADYLNE